MLIDLYLLTIRVQITSSRSMKCYIEPRFIFKNIEQNYIGYSMGCLLYGLYFTIGTELSDIFHGCSYYMQLKKACCSLYLLTIKLFEIEIDHISLGLLV